MPPLPQERGGGERPFSLRSSDRKGRKECYSQGRHKRGEPDPEPELGAQAKSGIGDGGRKKAGREGREGGTEQVAGQSRPASRPPRSLNTEGESCAHPARLRESQKAAAKDGANEGGRGRDRL